MSKLPHEELIAAGYNVVPVDAKKQPLAPKYRECYDRHCPELGRLFEDKAVKRRQTGLALLGRINPHYPDKVLVIIDVDDPRKFPADARKLLEGTWRWLTGPRCPVDGDKHGIKCDSGACRHGSHEFKLSEAVRGEAYAVLVPAEAEQVLGVGVAKLMGGAVEVRVRGYQLLPPSIHPSGAVYEWVASPWGTDGRLAHPKELSAEEFRRLLDALGYRPGAQLAERVGGSGCRGYVELSREAVRGVVEVVKQYYVPGYRNAVLYAVLGILKRNCVAPESIMEFYNALQTWAMSVYTDIDKKHDDYILENVLRGSGWRLFGKPKFVETVAELLKTQGRGEIEARAEALAALNKILEYIGTRRRVLILVSRGGKLAGANGELYYANHPSVGIVRMIKRVMCRKTKEGPECETKWGYDVVAKNIYIEKSVRHDDPFAKVVLFSVKLRDVKSGRSVTLRYSTVPDIAEAVSNMGAVGVSAEEMRRIIQSILVEISQKKNKPPVAGVLPGRDGRPVLAAYGPYGHRFRQVLTVQGDPHAFVELLRKFYSVNGVIDPKSLRAYAVALYSAFNTYRKLRGLRNKWLVLRGEAGTGKTQLAKTVVNYIYNLPDEGETDAPSAVHSAGALLSPARIGRDLGFTTLPKLFDEGKTLTIPTPVISDTIKRAMNGLIAYETAVAGGLFTRQYPAYAPAIITTQAIEVTEPGLRSKLVIVSFTKSDKKSRHQDFAEWRNAHKQDLMAFGRFYLETVINERPDLLAVDEEKYVWAAEEALRHVLKKLGLTDVVFMSDINMPIPEEEESEEDEVENFVRWLLLKSRDLFTRLPTSVRTAQTMTAGDIVEVALTNFGGVEDKVAYDGQDSVKIYRGVVADINGTTLENLVQKINEVLTQHGYEPAAEYKRGKKGYRIEIPLSALRQLVDIYTS